MKIAVIGAGNNGTAIAADLARKNSVKVYSSKPWMFDGFLTYKDSVTNETYTSNIELASNDYKEVVSDADIVFIALPTFLISKTIDNIIPYLKKNVLVCFVPGAGGVEFLSKKLIEASICFFGFERVIYVSRLEEYGKVVSASKKDHYRIASIPSSEGERIANLMQKLFEHPCGVMKNFISITLTPTLHVCRLYDLYADYKKGEELDESPYFYGDWRDSASYYCFALDKELHMVASKLSEKGLDTSELVPYPIHYESETEELLTKKIRSIPSLNAIKGPLISLENGKYLLDLDSRYFTESFPYRLCIVKGLAVLANVEVPMTDKVLKWYEKLSGKQYYVDNSFTGKDLIECNIPQNYGYLTVDSLKELYK